ncbi:MAG: hypothetical protein CW716_02175 [Candidatus Bathyarchaeum sp.]|nr:MAG: hypothetical protein CW716_02175 [Candidatus Bathyarchaeum sp.]
MNRKIMLPLFLVLIGTLFSGIEFASAAGNVGVVVGQTAEYTYAISGTARDSNGSLTETVPFTVAYTEKLTITQVTGTNITFQFQRDLLNGTTEGGLSWVDVNNGNGTGNFVIVSANAGAGDMLYPGWLNSYYTADGAPVVNETVSLMYNGETVEACHFGYTNEYGNYSANYYWEKSTGLMLKWELKGSEVVDDSVETLNIHFHKVGLEHEFCPFIDDEEYRVKVDSSSTLLGFEFNQTEKRMSMDVSGLSGTSGYCDVWVPEGLLWGTFSLRMDGYDLVEGDDYNVTHEGAYYKFDISYIHSSHTIEIVGSQVIPEFSAWMILPLFMVATLMAVMLYRKRLQVKQ